MGLDNGVNALKDLSTKSRNTLKRLVIQNLKLFINQIFNEYDFLLQSEFHEVYVDYGDYKIALDSAFDAKHLTKLLMPLLFDSTCLKYCSVSRGHCQAGYICTDGTTLPYASLNKDSVDALIGKKLNKFCIEFLYL